MNAVFIDVDKHAQLTWHLDFVAATIFDPLSVVHGYFLDQGMRHPKPDPVQLECGLQSYSQKKICMHT